MIQFTAVAKEKVLSFMGSNEKKEGGHLLRIAISGRTGADYNYQFFLDEEKNKRPDDQIVDVEGISVVMDGETAQHMKGAKIDWVDQLEASGFKVENPNKPKTNLNSPLAQKVQEVLDRDINPSVAGHGGYIELMDVEGSRAFIRMQGGCHGCGMAAATLKQGVEARIKEVIPEITEVLDTTDHAGGATRTIPQQSDPMKVRDIMTPEVFSVGPDHKLDLVHDMMKWQRIRHVPVVEDGDRLCGLLTHRDLLGASVSNLANLSSADQHELYTYVSVREIMIKDVYTTTPDAALREAALVMIDNKVGCLPVVKDGRLVGIITEADFLKLAWELL